MAKNFLIIYHSQKGHNQRLAEACMQGISKEPATEIRFKKAFDTDLEDVLWANAVALVTPEYFGNMSGAMKDFFDRTYYPARAKMVNIPYILLICCENDGSGTERNIQSLAGSYILRPALDTLIVKEENLEAELVKAEELGQTFAAGVCMEIF